MRAAIPLPRREEPELLDSPGWDPALLRANLRDIRRVNRLAGGSAAVLRHLPRLMAGLSADRDVRILDLATGSADIPLAIAGWSRRHGRRVSIVASDNSIEILAVAREQTAGNSAIAVQQFDARALPLPDRSFDVVLCSLALHHFTRPDAVALLREMHRVAAYGFILNDLVRGRLAYATAWLVAHLATRNPLTRHDAPLSVLRAFTPAELADLLGEAGIGGATIHRHPFFRMTAVWIADPVSEPES